MDISKHISYGNKKLPSSTAIFNCGSATNCPSLKLGLCQAGCKCYAMKAERQYPAVLPYRERQRDIMDKALPEDIAGAVISKNKKRFKIKAFRFNESGDFKDQADVDKMARICFQLKANGIRPYGYTARTDLNLEPLAEVAGVNVSNDKGNWTSRGCNRFKMVSQHTQGAITCEGDCKVCSICQVSKGQTIEVLAH